jgi:hypothetical protein
VVFLDVDRLHFRGVGLPSSAIGHIGEGETMSVPKTTSPPRSLLEN